LDFHHCCGASATDHHHSSGNNYSTGDNDTAGDYNQTRYDDSCRDYSCGHDSRDHDANRNFNHTRSVSVHYSNSFIGKFKQWF
jgi:hypothetical protein